MSQPKKKPAAKKRPAPNYVVDYNCGVGFPEVQDDVVPPRKRQSKPRKPRA